MIITDRLKAQMEKKKKRKKLEEDINEYVANLWFEGDSSHNN